MDCRYLDIQNLYKSSKNCFVNLTKKIRENSEKVQINMFFMHFMTNDRSFSKINLV